MQRENKGTDIVQSDGLEKPERLLNEINLLKIEGRYFCFDPKEASRRKNTNEFWKKVNNPEKEIGEKSITIIMHPTFGYPSIVTYKVYQAILKKLSDYGYPFPQAVSFTYRELARLIDRRSFGGTQQRQLHNAIKQLRHTEIELWGYDKELKKWGNIGFSILTNTLFSGNKGKLSECCLKLDPLIVRNLNSYYSLCLNYSKLETLEPIAAALYKRLFYHFSNLFSHVGQDAFPFKKNYSDICKEWLGGLSVKKHKSKIIEQLHSHLQSVKETKLLKKYSIEKSADGNDFIIAFYPGLGFFADYNKFYIQKQQKQMQFLHVSDERKIQKPLELVAYFYRQLYNNENHVELIFSPKETEFASSLLEKYSFDQVKDFIDYTLKEAPKTNFDIKNFGGIKQYLQPWLSAKVEEERQTEARRKRQAQEHEEQLNHQYDRFRRAELSRIREELTNQELEKLEEGVRNELAADNPHPVLLKGLVRLKVDIILARQYEVPSFEAWSQRRR